MEWLYPLHWDEIANYKDHLELRLWYEVYDKTADAGNLQVVTVRDGEKIVGYHRSIIHPHLHSCDSLTAITDVYFLHPDYRGMNGIKLFRFVEECWIKRGVHRAFIASKVGSDKSAIFERLKWNKDEIVYSKILGK